MSAAEVGAEAPAERRRDQVDHVIVFSGGSAPSASQYDAVRDRVADSYLVIAADSGADHARELGVQVDIAVGDFDSASDLTQGWLHRSGSEIRAFNSAKDLSDLELALEAAHGLGPARICVLGVGGGRPDHFLLNLVVLADERWLPALVQGLAGDCLVTVVRDEVELYGEPGSLLTLLPVGGPATVVTRGLLYPLEGEALSPTGARGLSNVFTDHSAIVTAASGVLLALQPSAGRAADV